MSQRRRRERAEVDVVDYDNYDDKITMVILLMIMIVMFEIPMFSHFSFRNVILSLRQFWSLMGFSNHWATLTHIAERCLRVRFSLGAQKNVSE